MSAPTTTQNDQAGARLAGIVEELVACYDGLLELATTRLAYIRASDAQGMASCIRRENLLVQRVAELEKERGTVVGRLAEAMGSTHAQATKLTWIARRLKGPLGERVLALCVRLKERCESLRSINEIAQAAAEHLAQHMTGLLQAVRRHLNHAQVYSRAGSVEAGARVMTTLDIST